MSYSYVNLTNGGICLVDDDEFERVSAFHWQRSPQGYAYRCKAEERNKKVVYLMHRVVAGALKGEYVDHINGDKLDNRRANLRICTHAQNLMNRGRPIPSASSQYKGVSRCSPNRWRARCARVELGYFETEHEAAVAYDLAAKQKYGDFAVLNFAATSHR